MNALVKKQQVATVGPTSDSNALLSSELLSSVLMRFDIEMEKQLQEKKLLLRTFLTEPSLHFLQEHCDSSIKELLQLVVFYDLSLNMFNNTINIGNLNLLKFMFEIKNRQAADIEFQMNLWNLLEN